MATSSIPNGLFSLPIVNSSIDEDLWGGILNSNWNINDSLAGLRTLDYDFNDFKLISAQIEDASETYFDNGDQSGAVVLDYSNGHYQRMELIGNVTSLTINNFPTSGIAGFLTLESVQDNTGGWTIDLTGGAYRSPFGIFNNTTTADSIDKLRFETRDGGTTIDVFINPEMTVIT